MQEHHAIIMTKTVPTKEQLEQLPKLQQQIYNIVLRTTLAMFADPYEYEETTIITQIGDADFKATGKVPTKQGWKALFQDKAEKSSQDEDNQTLPEVNKGEAVQANLVTPQKETTPPKPFTEGTLITAMKTAGKTLDDEEAQSILKDVEGIGTEATRANVLETLKKRNYLTTTKNQLHVTPQGITLCKAVELEPLLTSPEMTAQWEKALKQISTKQWTQENFLSNIKRFVQKLIDEVPEQFNSSESLKTQVTSQREAEAKAKEKAGLGSCPSCKTGMIVDKGKFYGCTNYKSEKCSFTLPKKWASKTLGKTAIKALITKLKAKVEDSLNTDEESSKKNEEIRRLNSKIEGYADDFKDMLKNQQELTARSQQLEYETHEQKEKLLSTQKELDDSAEKSNQLQEKMDKVENASLWDRVFKRWN